MYAACKIYLLCAATHLVSRLIFIFRFRIDRFILVFEIHISQLLLHESCDNEAIDMNKTSPSVSTRFRTVKKGEESVLDSYVHVSHGNRAVVTMYLFRNAL